jgi:hypothetical protein
MSWGIEYDRSFVFVILTGIFFCAIATTQSFPRTATVVKPPWLIALNAYSKFQ